jgi:hypothetical protein
MMIVIYNSENYCVVEYPDERAYEVVDKHGSRGMFLQGDVAAGFWKSMRTAVTESATVEHIDEFLGSFDELLNLPIVLH